MKNLTKLFSLVLFSSLLFIYSCANDEITPVFNLDEALETTETDSDFEDIILNNVERNKEDGSVILDLSPSEFQEVINITFKNSVGDLKDFFEDVEYRTLFRKNVQQTLVENGFVASQNKGACDHTYFAEAFSEEEGYTSSSSDSFAYARRDGENRLWASAFSCVTYEEVYSGYHSVCPNGWGCCRVRALYYSSGGDANTFGISCN